MGGAIEFPVKCGYIAVFAGVFANQTGLPLPSVTRLVAGGALAGLRRLNVFQALTLAVAASVTRPLGRAARQIGSQYRCQFVYEDAEAQHRPWRRVH